MAESYPVTCPACNAETVVLPPRHSRGGRMGAARIGCAGCNRTLNVRWARSADDKNVREDGAAVASVTVFAGVTHAASTS
jgi:transposase-like protein